MGKANRLRQQRAALPKETHEPGEYPTSPTSTVRIDAASSVPEEPFIVTVHEVEHHLRADTARSLRDALSQGLVEWGGFTTATEAPDAILQEEPPPKGMGPFDPTHIRIDLANARIQSRDMVRGILGMFGSERQMAEHHFPLLGFIERAQAFSLGAISMVEAGNPLGAASLLRSLAENLATAFYVNERPSELKKLQPGAEQDLPMGRVVAAAEKSLPGFKRTYGYLSSMAHPSGAGAFQTLRIADENTFTWQSYPRFKNESDANVLLSLLSELSEMSAQVIRQTVRDLESLRGRRP